MSLLSFIRHIDSTSFDVAFAGFTLQRNIVRHDDGKTSPIFSEEFDLQTIASFAALSTRRIFEVPHLLNEAVQDPDPGNRFMRMFFILSAFGQDALALELQSKAVLHRSIYRLSKPQETKIRLLAIAGPGDMRDNTPLDFLIEHSDIQLDFLYISNKTTLPKFIPAHDVVFVAHGQADTHLSDLEKINDVIQGWPVPCINRPDDILNCARDRASELLQDIPGLHAPVTRRIQRNTSRHFTFPIIIRPVDAHRCEHLQKIDSLEGLNRYVDLQDKIDEFYVTPFVPYQSRDGLFRKWRIALIDGEPFVCHVAISEDWMVNYANAGMEKSQAKRNEEEYLMAHFRTDFSARHYDALREMADRLQLDYVVIDCGEAPDGRLLFFEADVGGWVHATDSRDIFPYKPPILQKAFDAFRAMLIRRAGISI